MNDSNHKLGKLLPPLHSSMTLGMRKSLPCCIAKQTDLKIVLLWPQVEL